MLQKLKSKIILIFALLVLLSFFYFTYGGILGSILFLILLTITLILSLILRGILKLWKISTIKTFMIFCFFIFAIATSLILFFFVYLSIVIYRFVSDSDELPIKDRYIALIVVDGASLIHARELFMKGMSDEEYLKTMSITFPNISKYFIHNGTFITGGVSVWPSSSVPAHTGIMTGCYPRTSGVMGQRQFCPPVRRHVSYIGLGIFQLRNELYKKVKTLFEYFPKVRSVSILQIVNRGCSLFLPDTPSDEKVIKRTFQVINFTDFLSRFSGKKEIPRIIVMTLPDIDHKTHNTLLSDEKAIDLYLKSDKYVGEIIDFYKKKGIFDKTLFILCSDHGMGEVKNHVTLENLMHDMRFDTFRSLKWYVIKAWGSFESNFYVGTRHKFNHSYNALSLWGGNSDGYIYIKGQIRDGSGKVIKQSWDIKATDEMLSNYYVGGTNINVIHLLLNYSPGIGLVFTNPEPNVFNVYSRSGQGQIRERKTDKGIEFQYSIISGDDPLGYIKNPFIADYIRNKVWLPDQAWLELTYSEHYPDAIRRIAYSLGNEKSSTINVVATDGWDFTPYHVSKEVLVGSHGSLNSQHSLVPIMFHGPGIKKGVELSFARTVDILPTILAYFDMFASNIDGYPLPVFEDEIKNEKVINKCLSTILNDKFQDENYYYALENIYASHDKRIIRIDKKTLKKEIIVKSIKEMLPEVMEWPYITLKAIDFDQKTHTITFRKVYFVKNKVGEIYKFNVLRKEFE